MDILQHLVDAPVSNILMVSGLIFLGIAAVGKIRGKIEPDRVGRVMCGLLGLALFIGGAYAHVRRDSSHVPEGKMDEQKTQTPDKGKDAGSSSREREKTKQSELSLAKTQPNSRNDANALPLRAGPLAQTAGPVFRDGDPLPIALQKWPLNKTRYSQVRFSWNFPGSTAIFEERRIHISDVRDRLFRGVDYIFLRTEGDPLLVRVELQFRDKDAADYVRSEAIERLGAPNNGGDNLTWQNSMGGRSWINQQVYVLDMSKS